MNPSQNATSSSADSASERMTADRDETKFLIDAARARALIASFSEHVPVHRFRGKGENLLPGARGHVTTVYFDTPSRDLFRLATTEDSSVKLRAKEYYDLHPQLAELATDPRQLVRFRPLFWLELKQKTGTRSGKRRIAIPKADGPAFFGSGTISPRIFRMQRLLYGAESKDVLGEVAEFCARFREPLQADCVVNYRRIAWQDAAGTLRLTLDLGLTFFRPPQDLWTRKFALVRETLGSPVAEEPRAVVEVKARGAFPSWLTEVLEEAKADPLGFSKFESASRAVHG